MKDKKTMLLLALATLAAGATLGLAACDTPDGAVGDNAGNPTAPHAHNYVASEVLNCVTGDYTLYKCDCGANYKTNATTQPQAHTMNGDECTRCHATATAGLTYTVSNGKATVTGLGSATGDEIIVPSLYNGVPVTAIGEEAFLSNSTVKYVSLPASVKEIETKAFYDCDGLENIWFSSGLTAIGDNAFDACAKIKNVTLPETLKTLGAYAFSSCPKFTEFNIPASVESVGVGVISLNGGIQTVTVAAGNTHYKAVNNCIVEISTGKLLGAGYGAKIPDDGSVTEICDFAFSSVKGLGDQVLPDSVTLLGERVFAHSDITGLTINGNINNFDVNLLKDCPNLTKLDISGTNYRYDAVHNCIIDTETKTLIKGSGNSVIPDDGSVTAIGYNAFKDCTELTEIVIPHTITKIGNYAFANTSLKSVTLPSSLTAKIESDLDTVFKDCRSLKTVIIEEGVKVIGQNMFTGCAGLTTIVLPDSVTVIGDYAFNGCSSLSSITLGKNLETIGECAFQGCNSLYECYNLSSLTVTVGNADKTVNGGLDVTVKYLHTDKNEESKLTVEGEFIFIKEGGIYQLIGYTGESENLVLPTSCKGENYVIPANAFENSAYKSLTITGGVTEIGDNAFKNAKLESVYIKAGTLTIGKSAFQGCSSAKSLTILADDLSLANNYSIRMVNLTELTLSNTTLVAQYFYNFSGLEKINLTNVEIGDACFYQCSALKEVTINGGSIGTQVFYGLTQLDKVTIGSEVKSIGAWAFYQCGLAEAVLENKEWTISYEGEDYDITVADGEDGKALTDYSGYTWTKK